MKATISGQAGLAVIEDVSTALLYSIESPDEPTPIHTDSAALLFRQAADAFSSDVIDHDSAVAMLSTAWKRDRLLQMLLVLLSQDADLDIRSMAAEAAEELIASPEARRFAVNRLYSQPLPDGADVDGALRIAREGLRHEIGELLVSLLASQPAIADVANAWDAMKHDADNQDLASLRQVLEENDVFRRLAVATERQSLDEAVTAALADKRLARFANAGALRQLADARRAGMAQQSSRIAQLADSDSEN